MCRLHWVCQKTKCIILFIVANAEKGGIRVSQMQKIGDKGERGGRVQTNPNLSEIIIRKTCEVFLLQMMTDSVRGQGVKTHKTLAATVCEHSLKHGNKKAPK